MASTNYENVSREIRRNLTRQFKGDINGNMFATRKLAKDVLSDDELRRVYKSLRSSEQSSSSAGSNSENSFVQNINNKTLHDFLAVLLYAHCAKSAALSFEANLVFSDVPQISLPVSKNYLSGVFGEGSEDIRDFLQHQKYFCTIVIGFPEDIILQGLSRSKPWLSERPLGSGSFGNVFAVDIAEHHFTENGKLEDTCGQAKVVARKDFAMQTQTSFQTEVKVMKEIRDSTRKHDNVLNSFGTLIIEGDKPEFSLFMPKAEKDLAEYFKETKNGGGPFSMKERLCLISSAIGLADGLDFLHTGITAKGMKRRVCFHMDLKPGNVLIFHEKGHDIWKISDFGMSKVKDIPRSTPTQEDILTDFAKLFIPRSKEGTAEASKTAMQRGPHTFSPSEGEGSGKTMNEKSDVWALGCILSLAFTYMEFQVKGLERYSELRRQHSNLATDPFYGKSTIRQSFPINKGVVEQHRSLVKAAAKRGSDEKKAVQSMLDLLKDKVFVENQKRRCQASEVRQKLAETLEKYEAVTASKPGGTEERSRLFNLFPGLRKPEHTMLTSGITVSPEFVSWRLDKYKATRAKGCDCSPNGAFIAYWNEDEISLFTKSHGELQELSPVDKEGRKPDDSGRVWKAIKLSNRYLIAITTGSEHNLYIFDMAIAVSLSTYTVLSLPESETSLLDLAPDLRAQQTTAHGQIKFEAGISTFDQKMVWLEWRAMDILRLISHSKNRACIAFQSRDNPLLLSIVFLCIDKASQIVARLNETNFVGETTSLFTDMVYTSNDSTGTEILVVLHTKRITQVGFTDFKTQAKIESRSPIEKWRILSLTIDRSSGMIIALGARSLYDGVCLLEIKWRTGGTVLQVVEPPLAVLKKLLEADEPKVRICQEVRPKVALITALTSKDRPAVYQVNLNGLSRA
ncbi:hypothetical protein NW768_010249 [Fusarium equiseti]|uniref:Protein kinase domain-containing protein n=1 Tax=Fusarium equiseti TaxID=61235 RepID=A0ABQ8R141_FUSEQ|nr:hypothetical protein NW768_010249 [Fusarium equiseti]